MLIFVTFSSTANIPIFLNGIRDRRGSFSHFPILPRETVINGQGRASSAAPGNRGASKSFVRQGSKWTVSWFFLIQRFFKILRPIRNWMSKEIRWGLFESEEPSKTVFYTEFPLDLFLQICWYISGICFSVYWKADSAEFVAFRMYDFLLCGGTCSFCCW